MRTIETTVYEFDELSDSAKESARQWWRETEDFSFGSECVIDDAEEIGALIGIDIENVYYSGFSHQGQGACFTGYYSHRKGGVKALESHVGDSASCKEVKRIARELQAIQKKYFYGLTVCVRHSGRGEDEYCTRFGVESGIQSVSDDDEESLKELLRDFMRWIYRALETEYEYQMSDENADEMIRANEYTFTESGKRFG